MPLFPHSVTLFCTTAWTVLHCLLLSSFLCAFLIFPAIRNIVSTVNLGCKLDLKTIALRARNAEYNPKVRLPHTTVICYCDSSLFQQDVFPINVVIIIKLCAHHLHCREKYGIAQNTKYQGKLHDSPAAIIINMVFTLIIPNVSFASESDQTLTQEAAALNSQVNCEGTYILVNLYISLFMCVDRCPSSMCLC